MTDIIGHTRQRASLVQAVVGDTAHHAYLFVGPAGIGKRHVALGFAALTNCVGPPQPPGNDVPVEQPRTEACGVCRHCRKILAPDGPNHPDLAFVEPDGKRIKIAQMRELLRVIPFPPIEARIRFVVLDPADALGPEAANAILKTLEEPPSTTRFVLVTSRPAALLTTIRSRCQRLGFGRLSDADVKKVLVDRCNQPADAADALVGLADGSVGAALSLVENPLMAKREDFVAHILALPPGDVVAAFETAQRIVDLGDARTTAFDLLERLFRDALMLSVGADVRLFSPDLADALAVWARRLGPEALMARLELLAETRRGLTTFHTNPRLTLERLVLALTAAAGRAAVRPMIRNNEVL
ncbi:MAG: DNA polymerase-3 subunit delta' [Myxococcota bacterium]|jgi:DNA polymerase-3 subunit delta'